MPTPASPEDRKPRVLLVTLRGVNTHAAWCSNYEFEDVIRAVDDVDVIELERGRGSTVRHHFARSVAWRNRVLPPLPLNPGVKPVKLDRDYDVFIFVCMNVWDLIFLHAIEGWQQRCRVKLCYMVEIYAGQTAEVQHLLRPLEAFDHIFQSFSGSVEAITRVLTTPCSHAPLAADVLRFTPLSRSEQRCIDIFSIGRRSEPLHKALRALANEHDLYYVYDTLPGPVVRPTNPVEHREMLAASTRRSRLFITYPAKFGDGENRGQSEVGARYFEGAAAGAVLVGQAPTALAFQQDFPWPDAVLEATGDAKEGAELVLGMLRRLDEVARLGHRNALAALKHYDWAHRWQSMLETVGVASRPALTERLQKLASLADGAVRTGLSA